MIAERLLERLERVRATGPGRWMACCPAHNDKHPSLSIRELDDGRVLVHCFAECAATDVLAAVKLNFTDLYPRQMDGHLIGSTRHPFSSADALRAVAFEALVVLATASSMLLGEPIDRARLTQAASRIQSALTIAGGDRE